MGWVDARLGSEESGTPGAPRILGLSGQHSWAKFCRFSEPEGKEGGGELEWAYAADIDVALSTDVG